MCGIAGIYNLDGCHASTHELENMLLVQHHRGPEGAAFTSMNNSSVLLGFLQLGFTDYKFGMQPLFNEDGTIALVYNGEIYDYEYIRKDLINRGHKFSTNSDSEVIIHLYEEYGRDFVHQLNGEFAFALYDDQAKQLFLCRDPFGVNPLSYSLQGNKFYFSSEAKGILVTENFKREINPEYLASVAVGIPNSRLTLFKNIENLRAGHYMIVNSMGPRIYKYWYPNFKKRSTDFKKAKNEIREVIKSAVDKRLRGEVPIALSLSSGLDSTIIAGLSKELGYDNPTFSLGFTGRSFDESNVAEKTSTYFNLKFNRVEVSVEDLARTFKTALWHTENTTNSLSNAGRFLLDGAIRSSGLKAIMGGESSDEIFGGYPYFILEALWRKKLAGDPEYWKSLKKFKINERKSHRIFWDEPKNWMNRKNPYPSPTIAYFRSQNARIFLKWIWSERIVQAFDTNEAENFFLEEIPPENYQDLSGFNLSRIISKSVACTFVFPGIGDRLEMGNSLEGRVPFLDKEVIKYAYSLPENYCLDISHLKGKRILRDAFQDLIPPGFEPPSKHTFMSPTFKELFKTPEGKELYSQYLNNQKLRESAIVNCSTLRLITLVLTILPGGARSYLFIDSLIGLILSIQILNEIYIEKHPMAMVSDKQIKMKEHFPNMNISEKY